MNAADLTIWLAFGAGFLPFISPCCLPLYPSYLAYITGVSVKEFKDGEGIFQKQKAFLHTLFFTLGFSIIFFALGLSVSWIGNLFSSNQTLISQLGGILIILMGLFMIGFFKPEWMMRERRIQWKDKPAGY
jgi:cytochrome c-type biogenesis protein